jgi:hypothetical protein
VALTASEWEGEGEREREREKKRKRKRKRGRKYSRTVSECGKSWRM